MPLILGVDADTRKVNPKIQKAARKAAADIKRLEKQSISSAARIESAFSGVSSSVGFLFGGAAILRGIKFISDETSNLEESINAVNVVFAKGSGIILKFGEDAARSVGLANSEFNQLSTITGALLKDTGLSLDGVADKTIVLTKRASDLASVFNTDVKDALSAINQAIRGETEAIRRYAGDVTDATLQTFLLSRGLRINVKDLTQQEKRLQRIALIMDQTKDVMDDFINTQFSFANQVRITNSRLKDFAAQGSFLNEELGQTLGHVNNLFDTLDKNEELASKFASGDFKGAVNDFFTIDPVTFDDIKKAFGLLDEVTQFKGRSEATQEFLDLIIEVDKVELHLLEVEGLRNEAIQEGVDNLLKLTGANEFTDFVDGIGRSFEEDVLPPMEEVVAGMGEAATLSERWAANQAALAESIPELPKNIKIVDEEMERAEAAAGRFSQNLARALISGQGLEKSLLNAAISFGLSFIPGGSNFGGFFGHGGVAPGGFVPSIAGEGGGSPEIIQSATPIKVTPLTTTTNNNNKMNLTIVLPGVITLDRFNLENEIMPLVGQIMRDGGLQA